ncbi:MAG: hypothetical protein IT305_05235 [Chloroflexi bacterium]|nr:hypothetical protein [Chloroflexota bacterium]
MESGYLTSLALVVGGLLLGLVLALGAVHLQAGRGRTHESAGVGSSDASGKSHPDGIPVPPPDVAASPVEQGGKRTRPTLTAPPPPDERDLAATLRAALVQAVAERVPAGWSALVLSPPPSRGPMTWHVHLMPQISLDLQDGRTVPAAPPAPSHEWQLASGRCVAIASGEPQPGPTADTVAVRVDGPYLNVACRSGGDSPESSTIFATVTGANGRPVELRTSVDRTAGLHATLAEAVAQAVGTRIGGAPPVLGYSPASWHGHERLWLTHTPQERPQPDHLR